MHCLIVVCRYKRNRKWHYVCSSIHVIGVL